MTTEIIQNQNSKLVLKTVIVLVLIKCIYILLEYFYNINIFKTASSIELFNEGIVNQLNENGHRISSIGISLILTPIFYIFIDNKASDKINLSPARGSDRYGDHLHFIVNNYILSGDLSRHARMWASGRRSTPATPHARLEPLE